MSPLPVRPVRAAILAALALALTACGGGGDTATSPATTPAAAATVDPELDRLATEFIDLLVAGEFETAAATFDDTMTEALPPAALARTWEQLIGQVGAYRSEVSRRQESTGGYDAVIATSRFERSDLDIRVVFDAERRIAGLFFQPASGTPGESATAEAWEAPSYAGEVERREVTVGADGDWPLPGTLTTPVGSGPWPAVVLVQGSGPNDRDETIGPNKPFRDLALGLASQGIAVLAYDKRTLAHQTEMAALTDITVAEEVVDDAVAAVDLLRADPAVADPGRIFVLGHSLGRTLAPRIATEADGLAGLVIVAGAVRPLEELILFQTRYLAGRDGTVTAEEEAALAEVEAQVDAVRDPALDPATPADQLLGVPASYWLDLRDYRPAEVAAGLAVGGLPILVLQGERDYQVTMTDFALWEQALAGRESAGFRSFPGLNHLMMTGAPEGEDPPAGTSTPEEYEVPGHVAPEVVDAVADFIIREVVTKP